MPFQNRWQGASHCSVECWRASDIHTHTLMLIHKIETINTTTKDGGGKFIVDKNSGDNDPHSEPQQLSTTWFLDLWTLLALGGLSPVDEGRCTDNAVIRRASRYTWSWGQQIIGCHAPLAIWGKTRWRRWNVVFSMVLVHTRPLGRPFYCILPGAKWGPMWSQSYPAT